MIFTERIITVTDKSCSINKPIILYRGDYNVEIRLTIVESMFKYSNKIGATVRETEKASFGKVVIKSPKNVLMFSDIIKLIDGVMRFTITEELIDELSEIGNYTIQLRLYDRYGNSRASIPEIQNALEIIEPIGLEKISDSNTVGDAIAGYGITSTDNKNIKIFEEDGDYIKTDWIKGMLITSERLNKIETGISDHKHKEYLTGDHTHPDYEKQINDLETDLANHTHANYENQINNLENHTHPVYENQINKLENEIEKLDDKITDNITNGENGGTSSTTPRYSIKKNSQIAVGEMIGVAKSYYDSRYKSDGMPRFLYDTSHSPLGNNYDKNNTTYNGAIDCSTFIGMVLRGLPVEKSPYYHLLDGNIEVGEDVDLEGSDAGTDLGNDSNDVDLSSRIKANTNDYSWAIDPFDWKLPVRSNDSPTPIRTASQLAQWMYERGMSIPLDDTFTNVEPGDIIFWAKKDVNGDYTQPNRYNKISHVAMCINKRDWSTSETDYSAIYPCKHTMLEVTSISPYVLNRTLEKTVPEWVVMVCRPDLGALETDQFAGNIANTLGITNISNIFRPGVYYLTSSITEGLPYGIANGQYLALRVERTMTRQGKTCSLIQTLVNTYNNEEEYRRTQYCYSHKPDANSWTPWSSTCEVVKLPKTTTENDIYALGSGFYMIQNTIGFTADESISYDSGLTSVPSLYTGDCIWIKVQSSNTYIHGLTNGVRYTISGKNTIKAVKLANGSYTYKSSPSKDGDLATKKYVDALIAELRAMIGS